MINYQNGKIYAIKSYQTELIYIGSTVRPLSQRIAKHRVNYNKNGKTSSKEILKYDDYYIELIELFPCNSKEELEKQEGIHIRKNINICVNCRIAGRTPKEYCIDNKVHINERSKQHYLNNTEQYKERNKQYRLNNVEKIKERDKQYRLKNAEQIKEQRKQRYQKHKQTNNQEPTNNQEEQTNISENNKEKQKEYQKQYYLDNAEIKKQKARERYQKHKQTNNQEPTKNQEEN